MAIPPDQIQLALRNLSRLARRDFMALWATVDTSNVVAVREALQAFWPELIARYGEIAAGLAADQVEAQLAEWGVAGSAVMVRAVDADRANARMRWAIGLPAAAGTLLVILDQLVKQPYRSTVAATAQRVGIRYARVPSGADTCAFCLMLASRGPAYGSAESAGDGRKYHGDCDCTPVLVRSESDLPAGYDPDALRQTYLDARAAADSGRPAAILAALRETQGIN